MYKGKSFLAIIPARGGSKRLPKKNIKDLLGRPLIAWTIEAALQSEYIDEIIVTSDDDEILNIAKQYGAPIILDRPEHLSSDEAIRDAAIEHAIEFHGEMSGKHFDYVICLPPTSPLRFSHHIDNAIEFLYAKHAEAVISVCQVDHPVQWSNLLPTDLSMADFLPPELKHSRTQDLESYHRVNGAIYICDTKQFLHQKTMYIENNIYAFIMEKMNSVDIDDMLDFMLAETILKQLARHPPKA